MDRKLSILISIWLFLFFVILGGIFALIKIGSLSLKAKNLQAFSPETFIVLLTPLDRTILIILIIFLITLAAILMVAIINNIKSNWRGK